MTLLFIIIRSAFKNRINLDNFQRFVLHLGCHLDHPAPLLSLVYFKIDMHTYFTQIHLSIDTKDFYYMGHHYYKLKIEQKSNNHFIKQLIFRNSLSHCECISI